MKNFAILGSGFGLYGYLPALVFLGQTIILPRRYQERFLSRKELQQFHERINWQEDEETALAAADGVLLALNPNLQMHWLPICLKNKKITKILLEKPLASSPPEAKKILNQLQYSHLQFRIGYLFRYTSWGQLLLAQLKNNQSINQLKIEWHFMAHHFQNQIQTWKRTHELGGGVIRFYAIHLIALLAELGYDQVISSKIIESKVEYIKWAGIFSGINLPICTITVDTQASNNLFSIQEKNIKDNQFIDRVNLSDPFQTEDMSTTLDKRISLLTLLCQSLFNKTTNYFDWYFSAVELWHEVEKNITYL